MSEFVKRQQELKANLTHQIRDVITGAETEGRGLDTAELEKINRIEADIESASRSIETASKNEERASEIAVASQGFEVAEERSENAAEIFRSMYRGESRSHSFTMERRDTLVPSVNTVPVNFLDQVMNLAKLVGPYLETSEVFQRDSGQDLRIPVLTGYSTATEKAAGAALDESEPTYASVNLQMAKQGFIVKLANELITDAGFNIEANIAEQAGVAIGTRTNDVVHAAVVAVAGTGVDADAETTFTTDELIELAFSVDGMVRRLPGTAFMCNTSTLAFIRKLKDGDGRFILDPVVGGPDTILGFDVIENPSIASLAAESKSVFFGHWPSVKISTTGLDVAVSQDAFFANDITGYRFVYRLGSAVANGAAHIKALVQPAAA
jgi:HK97 family phage major capsid protein